MSLLKKLLRRVRTPAGPRRRWGRLGVVALLTLSVTGAAWLAWSTGRPAMEPVFTDTTSPDEAALAAARLEARGIPCRLEGGVLLAPGEHLERARATLSAPAASPQENAVAAFQQLARESDLWCSQAQGAKRWQAAKMAALSRLIETFPQVRSATVLYEPGVARKLGSPEVPATAAVKVELDGEAPMSGKLVAAVADLVAGSIAGMSRRCVRIVDNAGRSYRPDEEGSAPDDAMERQRLAEAHHAERVRSALRHVGNVAAAVRVDVRSDPPACEGASVCVPRSYFLSAMRSARPDQAEPDEESLLAFMQPQLAKMRQVVATAVGLDSPEAVTMDWYYDIPAAAQAPPTDAKADRARAAWLRGNAATISGAAMAATGLVLLVTAWLLGRRRAQARLLRRRRMAVADREEQGAAAQEPAGESLGLLQRAGAEELLAFLRQEHPQTIAAVLAELDSSKAAAVLAGLPRETQVEVTRRIAGLDQADPQALRELERGLVARWVESAPHIAERSGVVKAARILRQAGQATERAVLEGLDGEQPALAETIRRRMFTFDDIMQMPIPRLRPAMEAVESDDLAVALRTAGTEMTNRLLSSLPASTARRVRREMDRIGPVRLSDVEAAQQRVADIVRHFSGGEYVPARADGEGQLLA